MIVFAKRSLSGVVSRTSAIRVLFGAARRGLFGHVGAVGAREEDGNRYKCEKGVPNYTNFKQTQHLTKLKCSGLS